MADHVQVSNIEVIHVHDCDHAKNTTKCSTLIPVIELNDDDDVDYDFVSVKKESGNNMQNPICVDGYCKKEREFVKTPKLEKNLMFVIDSVMYVDDYDCVNGGDDEIRVVYVKPSCKKWGNPFSSGSVTEVGESSGSKRLEFVDEVVELDPVAVEKIMFSCQICADTKPRKEEFKIKGCSHSYCSDCMKNYVASKLHDGVGRINCPVPCCCGVLEPEYCREILPFEVFDRWGKLLCESVILASQKFYCPFKDCSALLIDDGGETVMQSECPSCFRLFCAQCKVSWHQGISCEEYQKLDKNERQSEDILLRKLAENKKWQRCPACKFYVEKIQGCLYMKCRCGVAFCYRCGSINVDCQYHYCKNCGR